jgi:hypothetical protein
MTSFTIEVLIKKGVARCEEAHRRGDNRCRLLDLHRIAYETPKRRENVFLKNRVM